MLASLLASVLFLGVDSVLKLQVGSNNLAQALKAHDEFVCLPLTVVENIYEERLPTLIKEAR